MVLDGWIGLGFELKRRKRRKNYIKKDERFLNRNDAGVKRRLLPKNMRKKLAKVSA